MQNTTLATGLTIQQQEQQDPKLMLPSDYLLSLAESLPAVSFLFVCFALLIIIISAFKALTSAVEIKQLKIQ